MTDADPSGTGTPGEGDAPTPGGTSSEVFRTALRSMLWLLVALTAIGAAAGWAVAAAPGVWGALIGVAITLVFSGTTVVAMLGTARSDATTTAAVVLGSWLGKMLVVIVVLAVLRGHDFYDRIVLAIVLTTGVIGSAVLDFRAVQRGRVPYVETSREPGPGADGGPSGAGS